MQGLQDSRETLVLVDTTTANWHILHTSEAWKMHGGTWTNNTPSGSLPALWDLFEAAGSSQVSASKVSEVLLNIQCCGLTFKLSSVLKCKCAPEASTFMVSLREGSLSSLPLRLLLTLNLYLVCSP